MEVAVRAIADIQDKVEVMAILSQSDLVREWRETVPNTRSWEDYLRLARDYVQAIQNEAGKKLQEKYSEVTL